MKVVIAGGGTAGHVLPALALARRLVDGHGASVRFVGTQSGQEARLVPAAGFSFTGIEARPLYRELSLRALRAPIVAARSVGRCVPIVGGADVVVGMGGYASVPSVVAAMRARKPIVLHEQNAVPGLANRVLARFSRVVAVSFAQAAEGFPGRARIVVTGNPVREEVLRVHEDRGALAEIARKELELDSSRRTVLVMGGSQGALRLDRALAGAAGVLRGREDLQLVVLTGPAHLDVVRSALPRAGELLVRVLPFLDRIELAYAIADLVVARAGASSIAEVTSCGLPALLVPYPHATSRHQDANARAVEAAGGATIIADEELTGEVLAERVTALLGDEHRLARMAGAARTWSRPDAAEALSKVVVGAAGEAQW